jgi:hypothetical protein
MPRHPTLEAETHTAVWALQLPKPFRAKQGDIAAAGGAEDHHGIRGQLGNAAEALPTSEVAWAETGAQLIGTQLARAALAAASHSRRGTGVQLTSQVATSALCTSKVSALSSEFRHEALFQRNCL